MLGSITDPHQLSHIEGATLCHGWAGLLLACHWIATDSMSPAITHELPALRAHLSAHLVRHEIPESAGLLSGDVGVRLALHRISPPYSAGLGWET
ncbi:hypothetical protein ACFV16_30750 [Streptomyces massasporeus]|uniref:hypothetical protein n=1 Tax=Streptomyces massasporeus TaxID=67324 RepID=UPI003690BB6C